MLALGLCAALRGEDPAPRALEVEVKAQMLLTLPAYVFWPSTSGAPTEDATILIGMLGPADILEPLMEACLNRKVRGKRVVVKCAPHIQDLLDCHVIYLRSRDAERLQEVLKVLRNQSILTVGDTDFYCHAGVMVNMFLRQKRIAIEINLATMRRSRLEATPHLIRLARVVD